MTVYSFAVLLWIVVSFFEYGALAAATWPSSIDELEDLMFLNNGYHARGFATPITPCRSEGAEGFQTAAQWVRLAFHDMATGNVFTGQGGLDASVVYEMASASNNNPGLNASLEQFAPFFTTRSSMSDLIALSVYTATRGCGGPVVPIRAGRIDATAAGPDPDSFLPQPQNSLFTFQSQFQRVGFNTAQMIAVVACGHTLGQIHASTFPQIATLGTKNLDSTPTVFDSKIASEYLASNSSSPLISGTNPAFDSDARVFGADGNTTITSMTDPATFNSLCSTVLQQMIDVVPSGVVLTDPIVPYDVKPHAIQLTLLDGGAMFSFTGEIRVRTTITPASQIASVQLVFKDRNGGSQCGSSGCTINTSNAGTSSGFDDSFVFYGFSAQIPTDTSNSGFNVVITLVGGGTQSYDNNGGGFPVQDTIMLQSPQSCLDPTGDTQNLTVVAAVRNTVSSPVVNLTLTQKVPVTGLDVPTLQKSSVLMNFQSTIGPYSLFTASYSLHIFQLAGINVKFDVSVGSVSDSFKDTNALPTSCGTLSSNSSVTLSTDTSTSVSITSTFSTITTSASATASAPPGWSALGCYADNVSGGRTLRTAVTVPGGSGAMTVELCTAACQAAGFVLAGVEYSQECWCDNTINNGGGPAPDGNAGCNMPCKGNTAETCGGPNRLDVYSLISSRTSTSSTATITTTPTSSTSASASASASATASAPPGWTALGCYADNVSGGRTLRTAVTVPGGSGAMTVELCTAACQAAGFVLAGVEYSQECWCDNTISNGGGPAPDGNAGCNMPCKGNAAETCGGPNRLDVYSLSSSGTSASPTSTTPTATTKSTSASATPSAPPGWTALGCYADNVSGGRTLRTAVTVPGGSGAMTVELCTAACQAAGFVLAGVEYSQECWCDNTINNGGGPAPDGNAGCNMPCKGNAAETCGGPNRLDVYSLTSGAASSTTSTAATPTTSPSASASATASAPPGWTALGCYTDNVNGGRTLQNGEEVPGGYNAMTVELCVAACKNAGFLLAGVEYAGQCWCDNTFNNGGGPAPDGNAGCNMPCKGNTGEMCGGPNRLDVYKDLSYIPTTNPNITGYTYQGCYNEPAAGRALTASSTANNSMTVENCASFCDGANYFGVEYGRECYCGASLPSTSTLQPSSDCSFTCAGNSSEFCGAGGRFNLYKNDTGEFLRI